MIPMVTTFICGGDLRTFRGLPTTFSRPIPVMFYHIRVVMASYKTIISRNVVLLSAVT